MKKIQLLLNLFFAAGIGFVNADRSCITCSSKEISLCATEPGQVHIQNCSKAHSKCFTRIENDGETIRGCVENTPEELNKIGCNGTETCELCKIDFDGCNADIFPEHRSNCLQCEGDFDGKCFINANAGGNPCPLYVLGDKCIIWKSETEKKIKRGCLSDESSGTGLCKDNSKCYICDGHSCNFLLGNDTRIPKNSASNLSGFSVLAFTATFFAIYRI